MFDLNLHVISTASSSSWTPPPPTTGLFKPPDATEEDSGTSSSSIVNVEEANVAEDDGEEDDDDDGNSSSFLAFDFMTKREEEEEEEEVVVVAAAAGGAIVTRQFFPVASGVVGGEELGILQRQKQKEIPPPHQPVRKSRRGPRSRSSQYRGVTFYRRTGRWESHIWDCGKQVYLGGFDTAYAAARAYDRAAVKFRGVDADINFSVNDYEEDMKLMSNLTKEEFVHILRRQSTGFSRDASKYRGMTLHKFGRWDPRMGHFLGKKLYDKPVPKLEPGLREGRVEFNVGGKGNGDENLDLSLGMSPTPICSKVVENEREYSHSQWMIDCAFRQDFPTVGCSSSVPKGRGVMNFALPPKRPPMKSAMYPAIQPNYELTVAEKKVEVISPCSSSRLPSYRWQTHGNNAVICSPAPYVVPMFSLNNHNSAASSGFSLPKTTPPPQHLATASASSIPMNKNSFHVPAAGGYYTYKG